MIRVGLALLALAGCSTFEDPDVVIDLRVLAITATPPEQVVAIDLSAPQSPTQLLQQLVNAEVCGLVSDPGLERRLRYRFVLCAYGDDARCNPDVMVALGSDVVPDPESAAGAQARMCATIQPNYLLGVLTETLENDPFAGLGGLDYLVQLVVGGEDADPALDLYAAKTLRVAPKIPDAREANVNPTLDPAMPITASFDGNEPVALPLGRCVDQAQPFEIRANTRLKLTPIETPASRESYVVPTIDGRMMMFTESLTYQWLTTAGGFSQGETGGTRDGFGNSPDLFTEYRAPNAGDLGGPTDVQLWIIQRDERYGVAWYQTCVRVVP